MATSTPLEEPAALAKRIEDFVSAIERPIIAVPAARLAGYQPYSIKTRAFTHSGRKGSAARVSFAQRVGPAS